MRQLVKDINILSTPCQPVNLKKGMVIGRELFKFLRQWNKDNPYKQGIGLAAPQLGINAQVCVVLLKNLQIVFVNPVITNSSEVKINITEGCLSLPGVSVQTSRSIWVEIEAENLKQKTIFGVDLTRVTGKPYEQMILEAVCVQHEYHHLQGILITNISVNT